MKETERKNAQMDVGAPKIARQVVTNTYVTIPKEQWDRIESTLETIAKRLTPDDKIITMAKACELLGVTDTTFRKYRRRFKIPVSQVGRNILIHMSDIEFLIKDRQL